MTFFPVVVRELQVAARRRSTFQLRFLGATGATVLGAFFLMASSLPGGLAATGRGLFVALTTVAMGMALISGAVLTADCVSREKREGTLGFLFLTDLSGWDVVAGKFVALSLVPFQAMLAVFPVVAMSVFLGGVTPGEFWRVLLVVVMTLFQSLALGMWVSSRVLEDRKAVWGSLLGMTGFVTVPYLLGAVMGLVPRGGAWARVGVLGPIGLYEQAMEGRHSVGGGPFWIGVVVAFLLGGLFLAMATRRVVRSWRMVEEEGVVCERERGRWVPAFWAKVVRRQRDRLRGEGNLGWLEWQGNWVRRAAWWTTGVAGCASVLVFVGLMIQQPLLEETLSKSILTAGFWVLKLMLAAHSVYFLHEVCRNGMMELLMVTPVSGARMWNGHVAAVRGIFLWPFMGLALLETALGVVGKLARGGDWPSLAILLIAGLVPAMISVVVHGLDFFAITYHSARWALHYDRPGKALFRTVLLVMVVPGVFCGAGRFLPDLIVIAGAARSLEGFRDLVRGWFLPGSTGTFGPPVLRGSR